MRITCAIAWGRATIAGMLCLCFVGCSSHPSDLGQADLGSLGVGIAREVRRFVNSGDQVIVFTTPGALGLGAEAEQAAVAGLAAELKAHGITVTSVQYTPEEIQAYQRTGSPQLLESYAGAAYARAGGSSARAVISLVGWPDRAWLDPQSVLLAVDWNPNAGIPRLNQHRALIRVAAKESDILTSSSVFTKWDSERALRWFDERFAIEVKAR